MAKIVKVDFTKRGKDLRAMKKEYRKDQAEPTENQKITVMLDKQNGRERRKSMTEKVAELSKRFTI